MIIAQKFREEMAKKEYTSVDEIKKDNEIYKALAKEATEEWFREKQEG